MEVRIASQWRAITGRAYWSGSAWRTVKRREYYDGTQWRTVATFAPALSASQSPDVIGGSRANSGNVTTNEVTITPIGGQSPFTYAWSKLGGAVGTINSPASARTTFTRFVNSDETIVENFRCTVTDDFGTTVTVDVQVTFSSVSVDINDIR